MKNLLKMAFISENKLRLSNNNLYKNLKLLLYYICLIFIPTQCTTVLNMYIYF